MSITRLATPADLPRLVELSLASFGAITWQRTVDRLFGPLNGHDWQERWRRRVETVLREQTILVLEESGEILGYAGGTVDEALGLGHLEILAVDPAAQAKGHGRRLLHDFERHCVSRGARHLTLESLTDNEPANELYRREGYQTLAQHFNWFKKIEKTGGG